MSAKMLQVRVASTEQKERKKERKYECSCALTRDDDTEETISDSVRTFAALYLSSTSNWSRDSICSGKDDHSRLRQDRDACLTGMADKWPA